MENNLAKTVTITLTEDQAKVFLALINGPRNADYSCIAEAAVEEGLVTEKQAALIDFDGLYPLFWKGDDSIADQIANQLDLNLW